LPLDHDRHGGNAGFNVPGFGREVLNARYSVHPATWTRFLRGDRRADESCSACLNGALVSALVRSSLNIS